MRRLLPCIAFAALALIGCADVDIPQRVTVTSGPSFSAVQPALGPPLDAVIQWDNQIAWRNQLAWDAATRPPEVPRKPVEAPRPVRRPTVAANHTHVTSGCYGWGDLIASLWPADQVATACRVMGCESGGDPNARNPSGAIGLFQLKGHGGTTDPYQNASVAYRLWLSAGWSPWVCR